MGRVDIPEAFPRIILVEPLDLLDMVSKRLFDFVGEYRHPVLIPPLPSPTTIRPYEKSMSFIQSRKHSIMRSLAPWRRLAMDPVAVDTARNAQNWRDFLSCRNNGQFPGLLGPDEIVDHAYFQMEHFNEIALDPLHISFFGPRAVVFRANDGPSLIRNLGFGGAMGGVGLVGHGSTSCVEIGRKNAGLEVASGPLCGFATAGPLPDWRRIAHCAEIPGTSPKKRFLPSFRRSRNGWNI